MWNQLYIFTSNNVIVLKLIVHHKFPHMWNGVIKEDQLSTVNGNSHNAIIVFPMSGQSSKICDGNFPCLIHMQYQNDLFASETKLKDVC